MEISKSSSAWAFAVVISCLSVPAWSQQPQVLKQNSFGCNRAAQFEQIMNYARNGDFAGFRQNLASAVRSGQCIELHPGDAVTLVDISRAGMYGIRRTRDSSTYWTLPAIFSAN